MFSGFKLIKKIMMSIRMIKTLLIVIVLVRACSTKTQKLDLEDLKCSPGYFLTKGLQCIKCLKDGCKDCQEDREVCNECFGECLCPSFIKYGDKTIKTCESCSHVDPNQVNQGGSGKGEFDLNEEEQKGFDSLGYVIGFFACFLVSVICFVIFKPDLILREYPHTQRQNHYLEFEENLETLQSANSIHSIDALETTARIYLKSTRRQ